MNVGANSKTEYGSYFAWGETSTKSSYGWSNLRYCLGPNNEYSKYVTDSKHGNVDDKKELDLSDDAAFANWGHLWCMPSRKQLSELHNKCEWVWTSMSGINGFNVIGMNGNSIFLPASGQKNDQYGNRGFNTEGYYWSRTLRTPYNYHSYCLMFYPDVININFEDRIVGCNVRAVLKTKPIMSN